MDRGTTKIDKLLEEARHAQMEADQLAEKAEHLMLDVDLDEIGASDTDSAPHYTENPALCEPGYCAHTPGGILSCLHDAFLHDVSKCSVAVCLGVRCTVGTAWHHLLPNEARAERSQQHTVPQPLRPVLTIVPSHDGRSGLLAQRWRRYTESLGTRSRCSEAC